VTPVESALAGFAGVVRGLSPGFGELLPIGRRNSPKFAVMAGLAHVATAVTVSGAPDAGRI